MGGQTSLSNTETTSKQFPDNPTNSHACSMEVNEVFLRVFILNNVAPSICDINKALVSVEAIFMSWIIGVSRKE